MCCREQENNSASMVLWDEQIFSKPPVCYYGLAFCSFRGYRGNTADTSHYPVSNRRFSMLFKKLTTVSSNVAEQSLVWSDFNRMGKEQNGVTPNQIQSVPPDYCYLFDIHCNS